uniref:G-protein coupled receptors family 1 profile domain-containing protein n=1 Tax=Maylandia zebra TaxID=106582 RepID=A0A3P9C6X3_9CICH
MADTINVTSSSNQTCDAVNTSAYPFFMLVYSLVPVLSILSQRASSSLKIYLKNLTAADFLLCLFLPLRITHYASSSVIIRQLYCSFGACAIFINMYASIIFMGYIAANRYLKIVRPSGTHILQTAKTAHIISIITWVFLLVPTVTYTILFFITQTPVTSNPSCCNPFFSESIKLFFTIIHTLSPIIFLVVFISLVLFYYSTSRRVLRAQQRQLASSGSEKLVKPRRNMLVLVSIFCVCFVPYHLARLPYSLLWSNDSVGSVLNYVMEVTTMVAVFNVCLDPVVYFFLCKSFRAKVRKVSRTTNNQQATEESESTKEPLDRWVGCVLCGPPYPRIHSAAQPISVPNNGSRY